VQAGSYIKIGRLVFVNGYIRMSNKGSSTGFARLTGLPFTQQSGDGYMSQSVIGQFNNFSSLNPNYFSLQREGGTNTFIFVNPASAGGSPLNEANFTNTSEFVFSMTYIATD
jgi:hypothetical protein